MDRDWEARTALLERELANAALVFGLDHPETKKRLEKLRHARKQVERVRRTA